MLLLDITGYSLLFPYVIYRRLQGRLFAINKIRKIAVFRLDGIGDLVLSGQAIKVLRSAFPEAHITLFVNRWATDVAELLEGADEIVSLKAPFFLMFKQKVSLKDIFEERRLLRKKTKKAYDLAIDLRGDFLSILPAWWLGARWLTGRGSRAGGFLLTHVIQQPKEGTISEAELGVELIEKITKRKMNRDRARLRVPESSCRKGFYAAFRKRIGNDFISMAVSAPYDIRCYPKEKWVRLIKLIRQRYPYPIVLLGASMDFERCEYIRERSGVDVHNVAGKLRLLETVGCIADARLFIGNDGGLIHIASAFNRPLIQLFGPAEAVCFGHSGENEHIIRKECQFNPCAETTCRMPENWCMDRITPEEINDIACHYLEPIACSRCAIDSPSGFSE